MKSETTKRLLRRRITRCAVCSRLGELGRLLAPCRYLGAAIDRLQQLKHLLAAAACRQHGVDPIAVEQRTDPVAVAGEQSRQHADELARDALLGVALRAELDAAAQVDQEPRAQLAVFGELAHVRHLQPRGHVPVDVAHIVVVLVLAQVGQVEPATAPQRAVIPLQLSIEPTQHGPLQALEQRLGILLPGLVVHDLSFRGRAACRAPGSS